MLILEDIKPARLLAPTCIVNECKILTSRSTVTTPWKQWKTSWDVTRRSYGSANLMFHLVCLFSPASVWQRIVCIGRLLSKWIRMCLPTLARITSTPPDDIDISSEWVQDHGRSWYMEQVGPPQSLNGQIAHSYSQRHVASLAIIIHLQSWLQTQQDSGSGTVLSQWEFSSYFLNLLSVVYMINACEKGFESEQKRGDRF